MDFGQALGKSIQVTGISCSPNESAAFQPFTPVDIPSGEHRWIAGGGSNNTNITCEGATGEVGERYSGKMCVSYEELDTRTSRIVCCDMKATFEPPSPGMVPIPPPASITVCDPSTPWPNGSLIDTPGDYALRSDLNETQGGDCIDIIASNVSLNCMGRNITGSGGGFGIRIYDPYGGALSGVSVKNCVVGNFYFGVYLGSSTNNILAGNTASQNMDTGIFLESSTNNTLAGNTANQDMSVGIFLYSSSNNNLTGNTANSNTNYGFILMSSSNDNSVIGNTASSNGGTGIQLDTSGGNDLSGNTANSNNGTGISAYGSSNNFNDNNACSNGFVNIYCDTGQTDNGGNICSQIGCGIACNAGCPPPACAPNWTVNSCPCMLNIAGNYGLAGNLTETQGNNCIDIITNDVTLDCQGAGITGQGPSGIGIYLNYVSGITVENCGVSNFNFGILLGYSSNNSIAGNTLHSSNYGIYLSSSTDNNLTGNTAYLNYEGVSLYDSSGNNITGSTLTSNYFDGILLDWSSNNNNLAGNNASQNSGRGITVIHSVNNSLTGNTANQNPETGIYVGASSDNNLMDNTANLNAQYGIYLRDSSNSNFTGNTACWNLNENIHCDLGQGDLGGNICMPYGGSVCSDSITCNPSCPPHPPPACAPDWEVGACPCSLDVPGDYTINASGLTSSGGDCITITSGGSGLTLDCHHHTITGTSQQGIGIYLYGVSGVSVENCNISNFYNGIEMDNSDNNNLTGNTANSNNYYGIVLNSANYNNLTGNTASSNSWGIYLQGSNNNLIGNTFNSNNYGIYLGSSSGNNFTGNTATGNSPHDFYCEDTMVNNDLGSNTCDHQYGCDASVGGWLVSCPPGAPTPVPTPSPCSGEHGETGINTCGSTISSSGNYVLCGNLTCGTGVTISADDVALDCHGDSITGFSSGTGIYLNHVSGVTVENCIVSNFHVGINLDSSSNYNNLTSNTANSNNYGIVLSSSNYNNLTSNTANSNHQYGIALGSSTDNNFTSNTATGNSKDFYCWDTSSNNDLGNTCGSKDSCNWVSSCPP